MKENIIKTKLKELLSDCEVQVWHTPNFISVEIVSAKDIMLPSDAIDFLLSLNIKKMKVTFKVEG